MTYKHRIDAKKADHLTSFGGAIDVKPLSVNQVWQGRRFKTKAYKGYELEVMLKLPVSSLVIVCKRLKLSLTIGVSSKNADLDNCVKPFLDILQKKYGFNDRYVYKIDMEKVDVAKGKEFIEFEIGDIK